MSGLKIIVAVFVFFSYISTGWAADTVIIGNFMWQQSDDGITRTWAEAKSYCESLPLAEFTDWRLPTKDELKGIVYCSNGKPTPLEDWDYTLTNDENLILASCGGGGWAPYTEPTINSALSCTIDGTSGIYRSNWSSTFYNCNSTGCAWFTGFSNNGGVTNYTQIDSHIAVRCVRNISTVFPWNMFLPAITEVK